MGTFLDKTPDDATGLFEQLRGGDREALAAPFQECREGLKRMVELRLDQRLQAPLDPSSVALES
jgi:hypothetical protein